MEISYKLRLKAESYLPKGSTLVSVTVVDRKRGSIIKTTQGTLEVIYKHNSQDFRTFISTKVERVKVC